MMPSSDNELSPRRHDDLHGFSQSFDAEGFCDDRMIGELLIQTCRAIARGEDNRYAAVDEQFRYRKRSDAAKVDARIARSSGSLMASLMPVSSLVAGPMG
jgi:hypothetical protein